MKGVVWIALLMMILFYVFACAAIGFYRHALARLPCPPSKATAEPTAPAPRRKA